MTNRILLAVTALGLAAFLVGGATAALLVDQTSPQHVAYSAGTISLGASNIAGWANPEKPTWSTPIAEMAPGQRATATVTVTNTGSLPLKYRVAPTVTGGLAGKVTVTVTPASGGLAPGASQTLTVEIQLPTTADSSAKGQTGTVTLSFDATNPANAGWSQ